MMPFLCGSCFQLVFPSKYKGNQYDNLKCKNMYIYLYIPAVPRKRLGSADCDRHYLSIPLYTIS